MSDIFNVKLICNACGKELSDWDKADCFHIVRDFGFGTGYDGKRLNLRLCSDCVERLVEGCAVNPVEDPSSEAANAERELAEAYAAAGNAARDLL